LRRFASSRRRSNGVGRLQEFTRSPTLLGRNSDEIPACPASSARANERPPPRGSADGLARPDRPLPQNGLSPA
jgi:hypothetical protein